jgi:hypothetical protein
VERGVIVGGVLICVSFLLAVFLNHSAGERRAIPKAGLPGGAPTVAEGAAVAPTVAASEPEPTRSVELSRAETPMNGELSPASLNPAPLNQPMMGGGGSECRDTAQAPEPSNAALVDERCPSRQH